MGRKNNKNKHKNKNQQVKQPKVQIEPKREELNINSKVPVIEVIEPTVEVKVQPVAPEIIKKEKREEMMNQSTEVIGKSSTVEEEVIGAPQTTVTPIIEKTQTVVQSQPTVQQQVVQAQPQQVMIQPQMTVQTVVTTKQVVPATTVPEQVIQEKPQTVLQPVMKPQPQPQQVVTQPITQMVQPQPEKVDLLITKNPKSSFSEALKSVRTNLQFAAVEKEIKVVLVSSPEPGDGKSLISSNLAGAYAQENKKVLIIDCDLRKGRQAEIFKIKKLPTTGYTNLILRYSANKANNFRIEDYICKTGVAGVDLIPNGPTPPNPIELLSSSKNKELLEELKQKYDLIILDCPPVLGLSDALVMTKYSDANIIVISKGKTKVESLAEVKKSFAKVNSSITGVITNKAKRKHNSYYGYYGE